MALGGDLNAPAVGQRPKVEVGSVGSVGQHLRDLSIEEAVNRPACCRLSLDDWGSRDGGDPGYLFSEEAAVDFGVGLDVLLPGGDGAMRRAFTGKLYGMGRRQSPQQEPGLVLEAFDRLQALAMVRRARHFEDASVADILAQVTADYGLACDCTLDGPVADLIVQANETDLDFLVRLLADLDAELWVEGDTLYAAHHLNRPGAVIELRPNRDLFDLRIDAGLTGQRVGLQVSGWDPDTLAAVEEDAAGNSLAAELDGMVGGGELLGLLGSSGPVPEERVVHRLPRAAVAAEALARSRYAQRSRDFMVLRAEARGRAEFRVGARLQLAGAGLRFDGRYALARVCHRFDPADGYRCGLLAKRSGIER